MFQVRLPHLVRDFTTLAEAQAFQTQHGGEMLKLPDFETKQVLEPKLSEFRSAVVDYPPFLRVTASFHPIISAGIVNEFYKPDPYFAKITEMWNSSILENTLSSVEIQYLNNLAETNNIPLRWLSNSHIELVEA